jgi:hypothetical protein
MSPPHSLKSTNKKIARGGPYVMRAKDLVLARLLDEVPLAPDPT